MEGCVALGYTSPMQKYFVKNVPYARFMVRAGQCPN